MWITPDDAPTRHVQTGRVQPIYAMHSRVYVTADEAHALRLASTLAWVGGVATMIGLGLLNRERRINV
jgi:hypothetical protein